MSNSMTVSHLFPCRLRISSTGRFVYCGNIPSTHHAHDPYLCMPKNRTHSAIHIVRLLIQLPAFSTIGDRILACRRYCKKPLSSLVLLSTCHWSLSFCFLRLLRLLLVDCVCYPLWVLENGALAVLVLRLQCCDISLLDLGTNSSHWGSRKWRARRLVFILRSRSRYCAIYRC